MSRRILLLMLAIATAGTAILVVFARRGDGSGARANPPSPSSSIFTGGVQSPRLTPSSPQGDEANPTSPTSTYTNWILSFEFAGEANAPDGGADWDGRGEVELKIKNRGGFIDGSGKYTVNFKMEGLFSCAQEGVLSVSGDVINGIARIAPSFTYEKVTCTPSDLSMPVGSGLFLPYSPFSVPVRDNATFTQELSSGPFVGDVTWRLRKK